MNRDGCDRDPCDVCPTLTEAMFRAGPRLDSVLCYRGNLSMDRWRNVRPDNSAGVFLLSWDGDGSGLSWTIPAPRPNIPVHLSGVRGKLRDATNLPLHWIPLTDTSLSRDMARLAVVADTWQRAS